MSQNLRIQYAPLHIREDSDGVMTIEAIARHSGVLRYRSDAGDRFELVPDDLITAKDESGLPVMGWLAGAPATNEHPIGVIRYDQDSRKAVQVGKVQEDIHIYKDADGIRKVRVRIDVADPVTQQEIRDGKKRGVSMGYMCGVKADSGEWNGQPYTHIQEMPLRIDHLAIVANPRAPEALITRFDAADVADVAWAEADEPTGILPQMQIVHVDACCAACEAAEPEETQAVKKRKREDSENMTQVMFRAGPIDVPVGMLSALHADGIIEFVELAGQEFLVGTDFADDLRVDGLIEHEDACGRGWVPGGPNGKCKRAPKGLAKRTANETAGIKRLGQARLNEKTANRLAELRQKRANAAKRSAGAKKAAATRKANKELKLRELLKAADQQAADTPKSPKKSKAASGKTAAARETPGVKALSREALKTANRKIAREAKRSAGAKKAASGKTAGASTKKKRG